MQQCIFGIQYYGPWAQNALLKQFSPPRTPNIERTSPKLIPLEAQEKDLSDEYLHTSLRAILRARVPENRSFALPVEVQQFHNSVH